MTTKGTVANAAARQRAGMAADKAVQRQVEADRRVAEQKLADRHFAAKMQRLRALRMQRDEQLAIEAAAAEAAKPAPRPSRKKAVPAA